ncbi:hypothetical protein WJ60_21480 [Burkholderia ubonensis]|uniref:aminotransferase class V-fold PLP-dependent enzyme n=1 Tax=Burkholderia ubonensis TaxID=101571 RepID=UPI000759AFED|nr:pyridoxal-dependent decarboxylase [Burkholderia ubonensis]KVM84523.1 hypothetical protein WJ60_21480 [Burkholderia ubonensis]
MQSGQPDLDAKANHHQQYYSGIQVNLSPLEPSAADTALLSGLINNLGDCYEPDCCPLPNTMAEEREAVETVAAWLSLPSRECWGYIGGGSTLGNLQGMWMGSTLVSDATLVFSEAAHYSVPKAANLLGFSRVKVVRTQATGQIDVEDLSQKIEPGESVVLVLTAGTTMTSAYDNVEQCIDVLKRKACKYYLHLDAALGGLIVPFVDARDMPNCAEFSFQNKSISSMTISAHKVLGTPMPANVFVSRQAVADQFKDAVGAIPYLSDLKDTTLYGSRDGFRAAIVLSRLRAVGFPRLKASVQNSLRNAQWLAEALRYQGMADAFCVAGGLAVVVPLASFERALSARGQRFLTDKYRLVRDRNVIHMYVMAHISRTICEEFASDCAALRA